ncbi:MAG: hypothetical protein V3S46_06305 [Nitrospinota bacterium]
MNRLISASLIAFLAVFPLFAASVTAEGNREEFIKHFKEGRSCVGYKASKKMFFFMDMNVIGINCDIDLARQTDSDGEKIRVEIPVEKFDSGIGIRDDYVADLLGGSGKMPIVFETFIGTSHIPSELTGTLFIRNESYPVVLNLENLERQDGESVFFILESTYENFDIKVRRVGPGGFIVSPKEKLTLFGIARMEDIIEVK